MMGTLTMISAVFGYLTVPHFPAKAKFLTEEERQLVHDRIMADRQDYVDEQLTVAGVLRELKSLQIWANGL